MSEHEYIGLRRVVYGDGATFVPVCPDCGRFVKADAEIEFKWGFTGCTPAEQNATCKRHGRVGMPFEGWYEYSEPGGDGPLHLETSPDP